MTSVYQGLARIRKSGGQALGTRLEQKLQRMESEGIVCTFNGVHTVYQDAFQLITEDVFITILDI